MSNALRARKAGADKDVARRRREKIKDGLEEKRGAEHPMADHGHPCGPRSRC